MSQRIQPHVKCIVGVAGGSGSGKSTLGIELLRRIPEGSGNLLAHDSYYKDRRGIPVHERDRINFDHPDALETPLLVAHLKELKQGRGVDVPVYDFASHTRSDEFERIEPLPILIVDGVMALHDPELRSLFDIRVFVDASENIRLSRRISRDVVERGRDETSVRTQFAETVQPMHARYVEPTRVFAHVIVPGDVGFDSIADALASQVIKHL